MSVKQMSMVWEHEFKSAHQQVMLALADHAHDDGTEIRPSVRRLAWKTGYGERQIQRILKELRDELKILILQREGGGRAKPNVYSFDWTKGVEKSPFEPKKRVTSEPVKGDISGVKGDITVSPEPSLEPSGNHPIPVGAETSSAPADEYIAFIAEELAGSDVPYTGGWRGRHGKQFKEHILKGVPEASLYKSCDRIIERWTGGEQGEAHAKLAVEQALGDVLNGRPPGHATSKLAAVDSGTPPDVIEYIFANTRNESIKRGESRIRDALERFDFTAGESPPYPVQKKLGNDDNEAWAVLSSLQSLIRQSRKVAHAS